MFSKLRIVFIVFLLSLSGFMSYAQNYEQVGLTPNAASFVRYGELPVNHFTGVPSIQVPIYTIQSGSLSLPLALSYHAGGNKVEAIASSVGLGWSITNIPTISRRVRGKPDEFGMMEMYLGKTIDHYYDSPGHLFNMSLGVLDKTVDTESDIYYFSLKNYSGRFYYSQKQQKFLTEKISNIKIQYDALGEGFIITDENGDKYTFGAVERSRTDNAQNINNEVKTAWFVSSIVDYTKKDSINFSYDHEGQTTERVGEMNKYTYYEGYFLNPKIMMLDNPVDMVYHINMAWRLKSIRFKNGRIDFVKSDQMREDLSGGYAIKQIKIFNQLDEQLFNYDLSYEFKTGTENVVLFKSNKWMFLKDVKRTSASSQVETHSFIYNSLLPPSRNSFAQDYWGYYNGAVSNTTLIPPAFFTPPAFPGPSDVIFLDGANRLVNEAYNQYGILERINYPTGGYTLFEYESNDADDPGLPANYKQAFTSIAAEGGNTDPDPPANPNPTYAVYEKTFTINNPPDGQLNNNNANGGAYIKSDVGNLGVPPGTTGASIWIKGTSSSNSHINLLFYESFDGYYLPNGDYLLKGEFNQNPPNYMDFHCFLYWREIEGAQSNKVGGLRVKSVKSYSSASANPLTKNYSYVKTEGSTISSGKLFGSSNLRHEDHIKVQAYFPLYPEQPADFWPYTYAKYFRRKSTSNFETIQEGSAYAGYSKVFETTQDANVSGVTEYIFNNNSDEINPIGLSLPQQSLSEMRGKLIEKNEYKVIGNVRSLLRKELYSYDFYLDTATFYNMKPFMYDLEVPYPPRIVGAAGELMLPSNTPVLRPYTFQRVKSNLNTTEVFDYSESIPVHRITDLFYDSSNLLAEEKTTTSDLAEISNKYSYPHNTSHTGDFETGRLVLLQNNVVNVRLKEETTRKFGGTETFLKRTDKYFKGFNADGMVKLYRAQETYAQNQTNIVNLEQYDKYGNLLQIKKEAGIPIAYLWSYNGQYPIAKIENASYAEVQTVLSNTVVQELENSAPSDDYIRQKTALLRSGLPKALVTSYTYKPLVGMSSQTDQKGMTTYYGYDAFQRLVSIKDHLGNIIKSYCYGYAGQPIDCTTPNSQVFVSSEQSQSFTKNNCASGETGSTVVYTVVAGKYSSTVSQVAADAQALADIAANGQAFANNNGTCTAEQTCKNYKLTIPASVSSNLYLGYTRCGSSNYTVNALTAMDVETDENGNLVLYLSIEGNSSSIQFQYGPTGSGQVISSIIIEEV